ncbi:MAG: hypothetical protein WAV00_08325 [Nocardioides sp.]
MDGRPDACAHCGVPLADAGRFCSNCGAPVAPVTLRPTPPATPAPVGQPSPEADPYESLYAAPAPAATPPPVVESDPPPTAVAQQPPAPPLEPPAEALPPEPTPTRGPGPGLWIGAAALLVGVLLLGSYLLLHGAGGGSTAASSTPLVPKPQPTSQTPSKAPTSAAPSSAKPSARPTGATEVAGLARASAPRHAPAAVDFAGHPVTYVAPNMVDGRADTCWRVAGNASGTVLTFTLAQPTTLTRVGLINGYAKIAFSHGHPVDWYTGNRRVLSVDWVFDDGTTVSQRLAFSRTMQRMAIDPVRTRTVKLRITSVSPPGRGRAARDDTAVSEVSLRGTTG